jgi:hypothetical protein
MTSEVKLSRKLNLPEGSAQGVKVPFNWVRKGPFELKESPTLLNQKNNPQNSAGAALVGPWAAMEKIHRDEPPLLIRTGPLLTLVIITKLADYDNLDIEA